MSKSTSHITWAPFSYLPPLDEAAQEPAILPTPTPNPSFRRWTSKNIDWAPSAGFLGLQRTEEPAAPSPLPVRVTPSAPTAPQVKKVLNKQELLPASEPKASSYPKLAPTTSLPVKKPTSSYPTATSEQPASLLGVTASSKKQPTSSYPTINLSSQDEPVSTTKEPVSTTKEPLSQEPIAAPAGAGSWKSTLGRFASAAAKMGDGVTKKVLSTTRTYLPTAAFSLVTALPQDHLKRLEGIDVEGPEYLTYVNEAVDYFNRTYASWPFDQRVVAAERLIHQFCDAIKKESQAIERQIGYQIGIALLSQKCTLEEVNHIYWLINGEVTKPFPDSFYQLIAHQIVGNWKLSNNWKEMLKFWEITIPSCALRRKETPSSPAVDLTPYLLHETANQLFTPRLGRHLAHHLDRERLAIEVIEIYKHLKEYLSKDLSPELRHWKICSLIKTLFVYERDAFFDMAQYLTPLTREDADLQELLLGIIA